MIASWSSLPQQALSHIVFHPFCKRLVRCAASLPAFFDSGLLHTNQLYPICYRMNLENVSRETRQSKVIAVQNTQWRQRIFSHRDTENTESSNFSLDWRTSGQILEWSRQKAGRSEDHVLQRKNGFDFFDQEQNPFFPLLFSVLLTCKMHKFLCTSFLHPCLSSCIRARFLESKERGFNPPVFRKASNSKTPFLGFYLRSSVSICG